MDNRTKEAIVNYICAFGVSIGVFLGIVALSLALGGCANRGIKVVASTASATNLGDINWEEYKIPVFSIISGPRTTVWVNRDYLALSRVHAGGTTTNATSALGIYSDVGCRTNYVDLEFRETLADDGTNCVNGVLK